MLRKFIIQYLLLSIIIIALATFPVIYFLESHMQIGLLLNFLLFFVMTFISTSILVSSLKKGSSNFFRNFLIAIAIKMLLAVVYFYFIFDLYKDEMILFVGSFFISYLLFTIFAIVFLVNYVNKIQESK